MSGSIHHFIFRLPVFFVILSVTLFVIVFVSGCSQAPQPPMPVPDPPLPRDDSPFKNVTFIKTKDGQEMARVPAGAFPRGSKRLGGPEEQPVSNVTLAEFYMDLYEVANEDYTRFVAATGHKKPDVMVFHQDLSLLTGPRQPAVGVDWQDANDYCRWVGKRLPTEAEWEKAAHGPVGMDWPWGFEFVKWYANVDGDEDGYRYTAPVGSFEKGRSPYGLYDMAGNVSEWVLDWYSPTYYEDGTLVRPPGPDTGDLRVQHGGSWNDTASDSRSAKRNGVFPYRRDATVGFRCAMDPPPPPIEPPKPGTKKGP